MTHARTLGIGLALASGILAALAPSPAQAAEPVWMLRPTTGPSPRFLHALAYDSTRGVSVLFARCFRPVGTSENSPAVYCWDTNGS